MKYTVRGPLSLTAPPDLSRAAPHRPAAMQTLGGSCHDLMALAKGKESHVGGFGGGMRRTKARTIAIAEDDQLAEASEGEVDDGARKNKLIVVTHYLPLRVYEVSDDGEEESPVPGPSSTAGRSHLSPPPSPGTPPRVGGLAFAWDEDALVGQSREGIDDGKYEICYVGRLPHAISIEHQDAVTKLCREWFQCLPVFVDESLSDAFYKGFCKEQLWPMLHYLLPVSPRAPGRFDTEKWQAYIKANKAYSDRILEVLQVDTDTVWIHDYHLMVLPTLLRKRFHRIRTGFFLHSPFPSSEIFRTFPKCEEVVRSLLNSDVIGFHTFDYARHFLSCCSRVLGLDSHTDRGSIVVEYYGRKVSIKIMPIGVKPARYLEALGWDSFSGHRAEFLSKYAGKTLLCGVDDMDPFKGIELKLQAYELLLEQHPNLLGRLVFIQVVQPARSDSAEVRELWQFISETVERINMRFSNPEDGYAPIELVNRKLHLPERLALLSAADVLVVTTTRDGMNLLPYEYVVCREGVARAGTRLPLEASPEKAGGLGGADDLTAGGPFSSSSHLHLEDLGTDVDGRAHSTIVTSEFVGCSPSLSGALRMNPWSTWSVKEAILTAVTMPFQERVLRHARHWKYVSNHTVAYWAGKVVDEVEQFTKNHPQMRCYGLGLGLDTFRMIALDKNFTKLDVMHTMQAYANSTRRIFMLDYDGTLVPQSTISMHPSAEVVSILRTLAADPRNEVWVISGRKRIELTTWLKDLLPEIGIASEHGFYMRKPQSDTWEVAIANMDFGWKDSVQGIVEGYAECTDGSFVEVKDASVVWHYRNADPDFGRWQAKELVDHLEGVLQGAPVEVVAGQGTAYVETKPVGVSKGHVAEKILSASQQAADFVFCVGDDRSDEAMFSVLENMVMSPWMPAETIACTVGQKPSKAAFYLSDVQDVVDTLNRLAGMSNARQSAAHHTKVPAQSNTGGGRGGLEGRG